MPAATISPHRRHDRDGEDRLGRGIELFGTAYWPRERSPERLGYPGIEEMPETLPGQVLWPLTSRGRVHQGEAGTSV